MLSEQLKFFKDARLEIKPNTPALQMEDIWKFRYKHFPLRVNWTPESSIALQKYAVATANPVGLVDLVTAHYLKLDGIAAYYVPSLNVSLDSAGDPFSNHHESLHALVNQLFPDFYKNRDKLVMFAKS